MQIPNTRNLTGLAVASCGNIDHAFHQLTKKIDGLDIINLPLSLALFIIISLYF